MVDDSVIKLNVSFIKQVECKLTRITLEDVYVFSPVSSLKAYRAILVMRNIQKSHIQPIISPENKITSFRTDLLLFVCKKSLFFQHTIYDQFLILLASTM